MDQVKTQIFGIVILKCYAKKKKYFGKRKHLLVIFPQIWIVAMEMLSAETKEKIYTLNPFFEKYSG